MVKYFYYSSKFLEQFSPIYYQKSKTYPGYKKRVIIFCLPCDVS